MRKSRRCLVTASLAVLAALAVGGEGAFGAAESPLKQARMALDIAAYEDALRFLNRALADDPDVKGVRALKGYVFYRLGQIEQALGELSKERERYPKNEDGWTLVAGLLFDKGDIEGAQALARGYLNAFKEDIKDRLESTSIGRVVKKSPNGGIPSFVLGAVAGNRGAGEEADARFREAHKLGYDATACRVQLVRRAFRAGDFGEALKRTTETRDPILKDGVELLTLEALALRGLDQREDALALFSAAADAEPFEAWTLRNFAIGLIESDRHGQAAGVLATLIRIHPTDFQAKVLLDAALSLKTPAPGSGALKFEFEFASLNKTIYRYSFYQDPKDLAIQVNFASMDLIRAGESDSAIYFLEKFLEVYALSPSLEYNLAQLYNTRNVRGECLRHAWNAIRLDPDFRDAWDLAGNALFRSGDYGSAVRLYRKAADLDIRDPEARYNLGCAQFGAGDTSGAEGSWREAISLESSAASLLASREAAEEAKGGVLDVHVKVRVNPISVPAYMNLAKLYADSGRGEQAIDCLALVLKLAPQNVEAYFELGKLRAKRGESEAAAECFRKYVDLGGDEAKTRPYLKK